jgi:hypothetical protein
MSVEWDPAPPALKQRIVAGVILALLILTIANDYFGWRLFSGYDKVALGMTLMIALVVFLRFMPGTRRS